MKKSKIFAALALSACVALGATGLAACTGTAGEPGKSAYDIAVEHGFEGTEQEWLESLQGESVKGDKGDNAVAPEIKIGENGNWFIDGVDTGIKAQGEKGDTGENGTNGTNGTTGENGKDGADGNTWLVGTTAPTADDGNDGDLYLDYSTWNVYHKESGAWVLLGNIKGEKGDKGEDSVGGGSQGETAGFSLSVAADSTADMPISGIEAGIHIIEADLGATKLETGKLQVRVGTDGAKSELGYSESRSTDGHNIYYGYIKVAEGDSVITFSTQLFGTYSNYVSEAVEAIVTIKDWEMPTLKADGVPVEIPVNPNGAATSEDYLKILLDSSVTDGNYSFTINCSVNLPANYTISSNVYFGTQKSSTLTKTKWGVEQSITISGLQLNSANYCYMLTASSAANYSFIFPFTISLKPAA